MAFGRHWEWRGFGAPDPRTQETIRGLPPLFAGPQVVTDRYLWAPGIPLNVKLRQGDLKLKRLLAARPGGVEEWLEDERENYSFPLEPRTAREVAGALGISLPWTGEVVEEEELLSLLEQGARARVIPVEKTRWQYGLGRESDVIVELAKIARPEETTSVSIEGPTAEAVREALAKLDLPGSLRAFNYLEAIDFWARGKTLPLP